MTSIRCSLATTVVIFICRAPSACSGKEDATAGGETLDTESAGSVASRNVLGCGDFSLPVDCAPSPTHRRPDFTLPEELLPAVVDELGRIIPGGDPGGPPPPFPG